MTIQITSLAVTDATLSNRAALLAEQLNLELMLPDAEKAQLILTPNRLEIRYPQLGGPVFIDFVSGKNQHRRQFGGGRGQPLAKAVGLKNGANPIIIDATAGFGRDAFVFASLGCQVTMLEQQPLVAALLSDAMQRAETDAETAQIISRMPLNDQKVLNFSQIKNHTSALKVKIPVTIFILVNCR